MNQQRARLALPCSRRTEERDQRPPRQHRHDGEGESGERRVGELQRQRAEPRPSRRAARRSPGRSTGGTCRTISPPSRYTVRSTGTSAPRGWVSAQYDQREAATTTATKDSNPRAQQPASLGGGLRVTRRCAAGARSDHVDGLRWTAWRRPAAHHPCRADSAVGCDVLREAQASDDGCLHPSRRERPRDGASLASSARCRSPSAWRRRPGP